MLWENIISIAKLIALACTQVNYISMYAQGKTDIKSTNMTHRIGYMSTDPDDYTLITKKIPIFDVIAATLYVRFLPFMK